MKLVFILPLLMAAPAFAQPSGSTRSAAAVPHVTDYKPPVTTDAERMKKLAAAFPIVDKLFRERAEKYHYPGIAYGIVVDGKLVHSGGFGYANRERKAAAGPKSLFRIASMTKSLTAMAILKLRDEGKLRLDDQAEQYIPELKNHRYLTADAPRLTVRHLLTHTAGFPEDNPWGDRQLADSDADLMKLVREGISNSNAPAVAYEYSNLGFALLGHLITVVAKEPYQQYITRTILKPLGMNDTQWEYSRVPVDQLALGYRWLPEANGAGQWQEEPLLHDGSYGAMGGLITSIEDFSKYVALHLDAWPPRSESETGPIRRSSVREMQQPWVFSGLNAQSRNADGQPCPVTTAYGYGLGWSQNCAGRVGVGHSGGLPGFGSQWRILPDYGIGVIAYGNLTYAGLGSVSSAVLDTLLAVGQLKPRALPPSTILAQRKNELVKLLPDWTNAERSGIFAENFFPDQPLDLRRKATQDLFAKVGKIRRVGELTPDNQLRGHFLLEGETGTIDVFFTLTPENPALIQQLDLREARR